MIGGNQKIRIRLKSHDKTTISSAENEIVATVRRTGGRVVGPIPLPTRTTRFTVNRSPFVDKKSREQFQLCTHLRVIDVVDPTVQTIEELGRIQLASGLEVEIKLQ